MFKRYSHVYLLSMLYASVAMANDAFYLGGGVGADSLNDKLTVSSSGNTQKGNLGFIGGIFGGYEWTFRNCFNLGVEAFADSAVVRIKDYQTSNQAALELKYRYNYGVRVLPGYRFAPGSVVYLIGGGVEGNFKMTDTGYYSNVSNTFNSLGYQLGIGASSLIWKNLSLRGDAIYSAYSANSFNGSGNVNYHNNISTLDALVSLSYKFSC